MRFIYACRCPSAGGMITFLNWAMATCGCVWVGGGMWVVCVWGGDAARESARARSTAVKAQTTQHNTRRGVEPCTHKSKAAGEGEGTELTPFHLPTYLPTLTWKSLGASAMSSREMCSPARYGPPVSASSLQV